MCCKKMYVKKSALKRTWPYKTTWSTEEKCTPMFSCFKNSAMKT